MKLKAQDFKLQGRSELFGTTIVLSDDGEPLGIEHTGSYSRNVGDELIKKLTFAGIPVDGMLGKLQQVLKKLRNAADDTSDFDSQDSYVEHFLPVIQTSNRFMRDISAEAWGVIDSVNQPPTLFQRGHLLVDMGQDDNGEPFIRTLDKAAFLGILDRLADFMKATKEGPKPAGPPNRVAADMMAAKNMPLPILLGIVEAPMFDASGRLATGTGYQPETR